MKNLKVIMAFIIGVLIAGSIVYAATSAKDINYARGTNVKNVEDALNDLYDKSSKYNIWKNWVNILEANSVQMQTSATDTDNMIALTTNTAYTTISTAFNGTYLTGSYDYVNAWLPLASTNDDYIGYDFKKPVMLYKLILNYSSYESTGQYSFVIEGKTSDGNWEQIGNEYLINANSTFTTNYYNIKNSNLYYAYRIKNNYSQSGNGKLYWHTQGTNALAIGELEFCCIE